MTLLERMTADAAAFRLFNHNFESETLQYLLNKGKAMYSDKLYDLQLSSIVRVHIRDNLHMINEIGLEKDIHEIQILFRECNLLCDYLQPKTMKVNKEVGRY